jgi:hypothetical protein
VRGGLRLLPSPPPIAKKAVVVKLPAPADTPEPPRAVPELPLRHRITEDGLDRLRNACPGWERQCLLMRYLEFMEGKPDAEERRRVAPCLGAQIHEGEAASMIEVLLALGVILARRSRATARIRPK